MAQTDDARPPPIYVIHGKDDFLRRQAIEKVVTGILGPDRDNMAFAEFDGRTARIKEVLDECWTMSLLAPFRVVCVRDADAFIAAKAEEDEAGPSDGGSSRRRRPLSNREQLEKYLEKPSPTGVLILVCETWNKAWRLNKIALEIGRCIVCDPPKEDVLASWIAGHAQAAYGCTLDSDALSRLTDLVGASLGVVDNELAKLATYVGARKTIRLADVENLVGVSRLEVVFKITDAVGRRDAAEALAIWDQVLATNKDVAYMAVGGLAYAFRRLIEAKRLLLQGAPIRELASMLYRWRDPGGVKRQLDRFSLRQWQDHLVQLLRIDVGSKTGLGSVRSSVEKLIVRLCEAP
jgi:DNA polymerase-3 subunit delta